MSGHAWKSLLLASLCACGQTVSSTTGALGPGSSTGRHPTSGDTSGSTSASTGGESTSSTGSTGATGSGGACPGAGEYCGDDGVAGDPGTLFHCDGPGFSPSSEVVCAAGCDVHQPAMDDACHVSAGPGSAASSTSTTSGGSTGTAGSTTGSTGSGSSGSSSSPPICPGAGPYCGQDGVRNGTPDVLYQCPGAGDAPSSSTACAQGCSVQPQGTPDSCAGALVCPGQGAYCGEDGVQGGTPGTLYQCPGAGLAPGSSTACASGCSVQPAGTPDFCTQTTPICQGPTPGAYCGSDKVVNGDANTLYECPGPNQAPTSSQPCAQGCQVEAQDTPDFCTNSQPVCTGSEAGNYCGGDDVTNGDANTLYHCPGANQPPDGAVPCAAGCTVEPAGYADQCSIVCQGAKEGNYCGGDEVSGGDPDTLYHCIGAGVAPDQQLPCSAGCAVEQPGVDDYCNGSCSATSQRALQYEAGIIAQGEGGACSGVPPSCYSEFCLGLVNDAYKSAGDTMSELAVYSAVDSLHAFQNSGDFTAWNGTCPCGAILFWDANPCNGEDGHIVICNGDGTVSTSGWANYAGSSNASIDWLESQECGDPPAGYALPH